MTDKTLAADARPTNPTYPEGMVTVIDHPMVQHKLTILRDEKTGPKQFRELVKELAIFEGYEATRHFQLESVTVKTPIRETTAYTLKGRKVAIVPILRAGLGMVEGILELIPAARVGHVGLYRDPETHQPVEYYCKLPEDIGAREVLIVDPMLATGGSASAAIEFLKAEGVSSESIRLLVILAAPEGIQAVVETDPQVHIYTCAIDERLDDHAYIVPGLGDAGDRIFGTK
jgi:uracil phosphoribosyltransferase